jgi:hemin uptake protein HemP
MPKIDKTDKNDTATQVQQRPTAQPERVRVSDLLKGARELILEHGNQDYRLRITASGKLILTK